MARVPKFFARSEPNPQAPLDVQELMDTTEAKSGFLPNVFSALSHRPDEFRSFFGYHDALMNSESLLTKAEKEMIVVATSAINDCLYCVVAHGAILRIRAKDATLSERVATDYKRAGLPKRQEAILDFAIKVTSRANEVDESDFEPLYEAGLGENEIWEIGAISAFFAMSNRLAGFAKILPNSEFYSLGR